MFQQVSRVHEILDCLVCCEDELLAVEVSPREVFSRVSTVNSVIIVSMLKNRCNHILMASFYTCE